ncbi:hypothetical protein TVAG_136050 [Trichomonas vaginalis G3]|uniref:Uncharacterized protein n=1 Tax=Trichomonas vaginalis (strain ATCC PRA-98 / G3) TaxID=412133 RepID=A2DJ87_TRIV3|nr:hypothetical protein TVAGG3_0544060 [Trichomonas vaginalis G3]EAY19474.1 hypothetical protein TVAG_136050 [Trichomonas vaginalis G3]KAI5520047.1 hypothetical protein TVAGG3_0544060 [Trichomonas vaginalis G3]|eukprot:XP_001580460.1 hypothetical protein [Trichomonas vaginalis G3]
MLILFLIFPHRFLKLNCCHNCVSKLYNRFLCNRIPFKNQREYLYKNYCGILGCVWGCGLIPGCCQCLCDENRCNEGNWFMHYLTAISSKICCCCKKQEYKRKDEIIEATKCDVCCYNCLCCTNDKFYCCCNESYGVPVREYGCCSAPITRSCSTCKKAESCCLGCCCSTGVAESYHCDHHHGKLNSHSTHHFKYNDSSTAVLCPICCNPETKSCCAGEGCVCDCTICECLFDDVGGMGYSDDDDDAAEGAVICLLIILAILLALSIFIVAFHILHIITADSPDQVKFENNCCCSEKEFNEAPGWIKVGDDDYSSSDNEDKEGEAVNDIENPGPQTQLQYTYPAQPSPFDPSQTDFPNPYYPSQPSP